NKFMNTVNKIWYNFNVNCLDHILLLLTRKLKQVTFYLFGMKINFLYLKISIVAVLFYACEKDDLDRKQAEGLPSFDVMWEFRDAYFSYEKNGTIFLRFKHDNQASGFIDYITFKNIEPIEDTIKLKYVKEGT